MINTIGWRENIGRTTRPIREPLYTLENIWLERQSAPTEYQFTFTTEGVTPQSQPDGSIWFVFNDSVTERAFYIPPSFAEDAKGVQTAVTQQLQTLEDGRWRLTVSLDRDWLSASDRAFPVRIDPELLADLDGGQWLELNSQGQVWSDQRFISILGDTRTGHMQFDLRDVVKSEGTKLQSAKLHIAIQQGTGCDANCSGTMLVAQERDEWFKSITHWGQPNWQSDPDWRGGLPCTDPDCVPPITLEFKDNYTTTQPSSGGIVGPLYYNRWFDVTQMVQRWMDGSVPNHGFLFYNSNKTIKMVSPTSQQKQLHLECAGLVDLDPRPPREQNHDPL